MKPKQRKTHIAQPLDSEGVGGKRLFVGSSVMPLSGDNFEISAPEFEKKGFETGQAENEARRKDPFLKSLKHKKNAVSNHSKVVPLPASKIDSSVREMVYSNPNHSRIGKKRKEKSRVNKREDDLTFLVQTSQAADICEVPSYKNVDSAHDNRKNTKSCRRSGKRVKDYQCDTKHMNYSSHLPQSDTGSKDSSPLRIPKRKNDSKNTDCIPSPSANKLMLSAEKENSSLANIVFDDSNNGCIPSMVNLDAPNRSDIKIPGKHKRKNKCSNYEVQDNHSSDIGCFPGSIIYEVKDVSGDLVLKNMGSLDKEMDAPPFLPNLDAPNCSDVSVPVKRKHKKKCLNYEDQEINSADTQCLPGSIIHKDNNDSGDLVLKNKGSLDKEMDDLPVQSKRDIPNCSDIRVTGKRKRKIKCLNNEDKEINSADTQCLAGSVIHKDNDASGDLVLKNKGSLDKEMDGLLVLSKRDVPNCSDIRVPGKRKRKIKCLNNEVLGKHNAGTECLPEIFIHEDKDDSGDLALKNMGYLDEEMDAPPVLPKSALRITFKKKLLVLDLNGILCDVVFGSHGSHMPYKRVSKKSVFKRPFLDDFMAFCFERFAVGIWSSRNKRNMAGVLDYIMGDTKDKLLFCWDQTKCALTGFNTVENKYKPLVLKELIKLWNKEEATLPWEKGDYSSSNTLLVDDSPHKAICNPPNTAIFPFPYDFRDESDNFLGPGGALRAYLESIAMADDVQEHVKKHSFGQHAITPEDEMWSFYKNIIDKYNSVALT